MSVQSGDLVGPYSPALLAHGKDPRGRGAVVGPDVVTVVRENSECAADRVVVTMAIRRGQLALAVDGDCCLICRASGSLLVDALDALDPVTAQSRLTAVLRALCDLGEGDGAPTTGDLGPASALLDVRGSRNRLPCVRTPWLAADVGLARALIAEEGGSR